MGIGEAFQTFCDGLSLANRETISYRYRRITSTLNQSLRDTASESANSWLIGSVGRRTAIGTIGDVDMIYALPWSIHSIYDEYAGNGQAALLQRVRNAIRETYPSTNVGADGLVVAVEFTDGMTVEVVPGFRWTSGGFRCPNSAAGGSWKDVDPLAEIEAFETRDRACNSNLRMLGRMARAWREKRIVEMSGILIDTLAYQFLEGWSWRDRSYVYYDWMSRDFFKFLSEQDPSQKYWRAPGSGAFVSRRGRFEPDARWAHAKALEAIADLEKGWNYVATGEWQMIYGDGFPHIG